MIGESWVAFREGLQVLGPLAGIYFAARVIISYQRDLLDSLRDANTTLRTDVQQQDQRIADLEAQLAQLRNEQYVCEARNLILVNVLKREGIEVPPLPESDFDHR